MADGNIGTPSTPRLDVNVRSSEVASLPVLGSPGRGWKNMKQTLNSGPGRSPQLDIYRVLSKGPIMQILRSVGTVEGLHAQQDMPSQFTPDKRRELFARFLGMAQPGDVLLFYHRTSWRSRLIKAITRCTMPHACVYVGAGEIFGMLKGRVRSHRAWRFFQPSYDFRLIRGSFELLPAIKKFKNRGTCQ
jgi:hypothetical protein